MTRQISEARKIAYYIGMGVMALGGLTFGSSFIVFLIGMGADFHSQQTYGILFGCLAAGGMLLLIVGIIISQVGARGLAGSGVVLDPEEAREDLEPFTRMAGGMIKDALDEAEIKVGQQQPEKVVMIKCPACGHLNEADSKFCQECGHKF